MKKIFLLALICVLTACGSGPNPCLKDARFFDLNTGETVSYRQLDKHPAIYGVSETQLFDSPQAFSFVRFKADDFQLEVVSAEREQADSISALSSKHGAVAGMNGSYFNMRELTHTTYIKDDGFSVGQTTESELFRTNGAVLMGSDSFVIDAVKADTTWTGGDSWREVMAGGPILIDEGQVIEYEEGIAQWEGFYAKRHPRSLVGTDAQGYVWLVVVDGRAPGKAEGMSIAELTELSRQLGLTDALNLDGGGSSALWVLPAGVISRPSDNKRFDNEGQRIIPNALLVKPQ